MVSAVHDAVPATALTGTSRAQVRRRCPLLPNQHGAWGFLALPLVLGAAASGWSPWLLPLGAAWIAAYPASWAVTGLLTARRPGRFRKAALVWSTTSLFLGLPVLSARPWLSWVLLGCLALFAVNLQQARRGRERSLLNDLILVAQCTVLVPVIAGVDQGRAGPGLPTASMTAHPVLIATSVCALTLIGSTLHVKSLIRERRNPAFTRASRVFASACPPAVWCACAAAGVSTWMAAPFVATAARAIWLHNPAWRPARIGLVELGGLVAVATTALLVLRR